MKSQITRPLITPIALPLFGDHEIKEEIISDPEVYESVNAYHPNIKLCTNTLICASKTKDNF